MWRSTVSPVAGGAPWPIGSLHAVVVRSAAVLGVLVAVYVAAQLGGAAHASRVVAVAGVPLAVATALTVRTRSADGSSVALQSITPSLAAVLIVAGSLFLLVLLPVLLTQLPPEDDYPNYLARIHVIVTGERDVLLAQFYAIRWGVIPNLGMELLAPALAMATSVFFASKLFLVTAMLLLLAGPLAIHWALYRRAAFGPLVTALFAYNGVSKMGILNYEFGVGLALFAIATWIALRARGAMSRATGSAAWVIVLFFCHLEALGIYGLAIGSFELWHAWPNLRVRRHLLIDAAVLVLPFALAIPLLLLGPSKHGAYATPTVWGGIHARIDGIRFLFASYDPRLDLLAMLAIVAGFVLALRSGTLSLHPFGWIVLVVMGAAYMVIPNELHGTWGAADRLPIVTLLVVIGALRWDFSTLRAQVIFVTALFLLTLFRTAAVEAAFSRYAHIVADVQASLALVPRGSRVLVADTDAKPPDALNGAIQELPLLAMVERSSLVSLAYSHPLQQILAVRPPYRASSGGFDDQPVPLPLLLSPPPPPPPGTELPFAPSGRIYWRDWPHDYDFVYVIDRFDPTSPAPNRLQLVYQGDRFQLLHVIHR